MELTYDYLVNSREYAEMLPYWSFNTREEFESLFGMRNGTRMNKILLAFITSKSVFEFRHAFVSAFSMAEMKALCLRNLANYDGKLVLMNRVFSLDGYQTDLREGICADGDTNSVRYLHDGRLAKMRSGRLFQKIIRESRFGKRLPEPVITWLCEEFSSEWTAHVERAKEKRYILVTGHTDELTFADIYGNGSYRTTHFGSCMDREKRHPFYDKSLKDCYPAALVDKKDPKKIIARCVVYNHVEDVDTGDVYRLAERQYTDEGDGAKRALVNELVDNGLIDGWKMVGASCHDGWNFVLKDGTSLQTKRLSVDVSFKDNNILSYQDSFKWYDNDAKKAYNFHPDRYDLKLDSTSPRVAIGFDSYHNKEVIGSYIVDVWVGGQRMTCAEKDLADFVRSCGSYYHKEKDTKICPACGELMGAHHMPSNVYSKILKTTFCCIGCLNDAEREVGEKKFYYSVFDDEYVKKASELTEAYMWSEKYVRNSYRRGYLKMSIKKTTLDALKMLDRVITYKGRVYVRYDKVNNVPFGVRQDKKPTMFNPA